MPDRSAQSVRADADAAATQDANDAASNAESAATDARSAKTNANEAAAKANNQANNASRAATRADSAADAIGALGPVDGVAESKSGSDLVKSDGTTISASSHNGELWFVTNEGAYYQSDGSSWNLKLRLPADLALVGSISEMKNNSFDPGTVVYVSDRKRGGFFYHSDVDVYGSGSEDGGVVFEVPNGWRVRIFSDTVNIRWFGAEKGVESGAEIQKAVNFVENATEEFALKIPSGIYLTSQRIIFDEPFSLESNGVIKQSGGADLSRVVEVSGTFGVSDSFDFHLNVDGNKGANSQSVTGIYSVNSSIMRNAHFEATNCDVGINIFGTLESAHLDIFVYECDVGLRYETTDGQGDNTSDENIINLNGHFCGEYLRVPATGTGTPSATVNLGVEQADDKILTIEKGSFVLTGVVRGFKGNTGINIDDGRIQFNDVTIVGSGGLGVLVEVATNVHGNIQVRGTDRALKINALRSGGDIHVMAEDCLGNNGAVIQLGDAGLGKQLFDCVVTASIEDCENGVELNNTQGCTLNLRESLIVSNNDEVTLGDTQRDKINLSWRNFDASIVGTPSDPPIIEYDCALNDQRRSNIPNYYRGMIIKYNPDDGLPNYYNGSDWVLPDGTTT